MIPINPGEPKQKRLYLGRKGASPFYNVLVFRDQAEMAEFCRQVDKRAGDRAGNYSRTWGMCRCFKTAAKRRPRRGQIGFVVLHRQQIGAGIVSHEMTHAALYYVGWEEFPVRISKRLDERLAWVQGYLVQQFWQWFYRQPGAPKQPK